MERLDSFNRRTLDGLAARVYFYYAWSHEYTDQLASIQRCLLGCSRGLGTCQIADLAAVRSKLLALHQLAVLRHDEYCQETLINLLIRSFLHYNLYEQVRSAALRAQCLPGYAAHASCCRRSSSGRARSGRRWTGARSRWCATCSTTAASAPSSSTTPTPRTCCPRPCARCAAAACCTVCSAVPDSSEAVQAPSGAQGFRNTATKWLMLVRLLLGEVPAHEDFQGPGAARSLAPYFRLTQAVRLGDLTAFRRVMCYVGVRTTEQPCSSTHARRPQLLHSCQACRQVAEAEEAVWMKDRTHNLVVRLRHNVIRAGLFRISLAYWRISLADVASKLGACSICSACQQPAASPNFAVSAGLASVQDTEYIVAKAIRDGGIEAEIDHEHGWITSRATPNTYSTSDPQLAFHRRVAFCMDLHNEVRAGAAACALCGCWP